jgi:hypothetical protein
MEDCPRLLWRKDMRFLLTGTTNDSILVVQYQHRIFLHQIVLTEACTPFGVGNFSAIATAVLLRFSHDTVKNMTEEVNRR